MALIKTHRQGWAIALTALGFLALMVVPSMGALPLLVDQTLQRVMLFALVAAFVALIGGARALVPRASGLRRALREGRYPVLLALALCALEVLGLLQASAVGEAVAISPAWAVDLAQVALFCASVGLYEEALFRVLFLGGLLSRHGGTRNGVVGSVLVSSVAFGAAHVILSASLDPIVLIQMLLKTVQTTFIGLLLGAVYVRTRSFVGVAALHALTDFLLMVPLALLGGLGDSLGTYVSGGDGLAAVVEGLVLVAVYVVVVALYVPAAVRAWKLLESAPVPEAGPFSEGWGPRADDDARLVTEDSRPVRPSGL